MDESRAQRFIRNVICQRKISCEFLKAGESLGKNGKGSNDPLLIAFMGLCERSCIQHSGPLPLKDQAVDSFIV